ncbi:hypothetical protein CASFOL_028839 [Castilleja foliolosa]|uniref:Myb-like domain-containing protein n=1 Tax=Castilleja foliolosa TaxID=1961234 RepID=A0ABD3CEM2_9LAMI
MAEQRIEIGCPSPRWTWQEDKQFESGLVEFPKICPNRWEKIAARLGTKSAAEVERHYATLFTDLEAGPPERYTDDVEEVVLPQRERTGAPGNNTLKRNFRSLRVFFFTS